MSDDLEEYARTRDVHLRDELVARHLPLAKFVARRMRANLPEHIDLDDLVALASIGLLDAIEKFDPAKGFKFSTYAVTRIRGAVLDGLQQMDWAPKHINTRVWKLRRAIGVLATKLEREPTDAELAEEMALSIEEVRAARVDSQRMVINGLEVPLASDSDGPQARHEVVDLNGWESDLAGEISELRGYVASALSGLGAREAAVLTLYYRDGLNLRQVADRLGVSATSAITTHTQLIEKVRTRLSVVGGMLN